MSSASGKTKTERAYRHIRNRLASGDFLPGAQLSEGSFSTQLGVGRTPVREAFLLLENEGFIEQVPRYGTFVKQPDRYEQQSLYELREVLESYAAGKAAAYMTDAGIAELKGLCDQMRKTVHAVRDAGGRATPELVARVAVADIQFHIAILRACGNSLVIRSVSNLHLMSRIWGVDRGNPMRKTLRDWVQSYREHLRVFRAIRDRNAERASHWMGVHLQHATQMALEYLDHQRRAQGPDTDAFEWSQAVQDAVKRLEGISVDNDSI